VEWGPLSPADRRPYPDKETLAENAGPAPRLFKG
jgi:hypothetical protein